MAEQHKTIKGFILSIQTKQNEGIDKSIECGIVVTNDFGIKDNLCEIGK